MKVRLTAACTNEIQEDIRSFLTDFLDNVSIQDSEKNQIILAIDEAVVNAITHGHKHDPNAHVEIQMELTPKKFKAIIGDIRLFDPAEDGKGGKNIDIDKVIKERKKGGMGLKLIYSIMDMVVFYTKDTQSFCSMVKVLNKPN